MAEANWSRRGFVGLMAAGGIGLASGGALAQADGVLERVRKAGVIKIGMTNGLPYSLLNPDGSVDGVAPTLVKTVMARLGVPKVEGIVGSYGQLIPGLLAGRWDMVGADMTITKERCEQVTYCDPFTVDYAAYVYLPGAFASPPKSLKEMGQRKIKLAMLAGTYNLKVVQSFYEKPDEFIATYPDTNSILEAVTAKRAEIGCTGIVLIKEVLKGKPGAFEHVDPMPDDLLSPGSAAFRPGDTDLITAFKAEFQKMKKSGEWQKIIGTFGFEISPRTENMTAEQACSGTV